MVAVPVQSALISYVPVSFANPVDVGEPPITTKSSCVNFPFPLKVVIATPFWGATMPGPGRIWPEMVWPYLPFSEAFEHAAACAVDTAPSARQATAVANVALQNVLFQNQVFIFLSPQSLIFWARRPQSSRSRGRLQEPGTIGNGAYLTMR